jgi:hypothetical protein
MTETEKFRTERLVARPWQIEDLPLRWNCGDPAVTTLIDSRGKLTNAKSERISMPRSSARVRWRTKLGPVRSLQWRVRRLRRASDVALYARRGEFRQQICSGRKVSSQREWRKYFPAAAECRPHPTNPAHSSPRKYTAIARRRTRGTDARASSARGIRHGAAFCVVPDRILLHALIRTPESSAIPSFTPAAPARPTWIRVRP